MLTFKYFPFSDMFIQKFRAQNNGRSMDNVCGQHDSLTAQILGWPDFLSGYIH